MKKDRYYLAILRCMPYPIASAWHRIHLAFGETDGIRRQEDCLVVVLRTMVSFMLPDYLRGSPHEYVEELIPALVKPSLAK